MATLKEIEQRIISLEEQIKSLTDERPQKKDLQVLKHEIKEDTRSEIDHKLMDLKAGMLKFLKYTIPIVTFILLILGYLGYKDVNAAIEKISNQLLVEGRKRIDSIDIELKRYKENLKIIDKMDELIENGNKLFVHFDQNPSLAFKEFAAWKLEIASFVESLNLPKDFPYNGRKMSHLMAMISDVHQKQGDQYYKAITQTNSILQGYIDFLKIRTNPQENMSGK